MSWELAIFAGLALVLIGGFAWYERSRPPAQIVALVAALAALAVAGRIVFAPIPNVVATTDIVLLSGYALGGAPGFVVGALAAVVSNFWLGQGPWTPWQMAGWGMCGLLGAALAAFAGRDLGRLPLAIACALAGFAYGALLDFSLMVTYGGEQSLDRYLALSARGIPFNIAHAAGNFTLALIAGPALVRMLIRFRKRFEIRWRELPAAAATALMLIAVSLGLGLGAAGETAAAKRGGSGKALAWLADAQNSDGGFAAIEGSSSSPAMTGWAVLGAEAAGRHPAALRQGGKSALGYLRKNAGAIRSTGDYERTILALAAARKNPRRFGGRNLVSRLRARRGGDGSYESQVNLTAFGVLALRAAGSPRGNGRSLSWLRSYQNADGGWGFSPTAASDADSTGAVLQALAAGGGGRSAASRRGVSYLRKVQRPNGGFPLAGGSVNSQSTAWAVQGLVAAGVNPARVRKNGRSPLTYLKRMQARDGHYRYSASSDQTPIWVTAQVLLAVNREAFPVKPVKRAKQSGGGGAAESGAVAPAPAPGYGAGGGAAAGGADPGGGGKPDAPSKPPKPAPEPEVESEAPAAEADPASDDPDESDDSNTLAMLAGVLAVVIVTLGGGWLLYRGRPS